MICKACGYEHETEYQDRKLVTIKGKNPFIQINGHFTYEVDSNYGGTHLAETSIYACPECFTLRMKEPW
jgi:hypothetical protein